MTLQLILFLATLATLAITHNLAIEFYLYWKYPWLDVLTHFLGGISVVLGYASLPFFRMFRMRLAERFQKPGFYLFVVLIIGIIWEIFEVKAGIMILDETFLPDTTLDLLMDVFGGIIGYGLVRVLNKL